MMENEFQMSMIGEPAFFLGIQVKQTTEGTLHLTVTLKLLHALYIVKQFNESSGISNKVLSLGFRILLLLCWILLAFQMLTIRALLLLAIF
jgi:hypothetical protein